jgi:hypothetical protein
MCETWRYIDNIDYLDVWFTWLHARAHRAIEDRDPPPLEFPIKKVKAGELWTCREKAARKTIRDRLAAHREDPEAAPLGLELLREEHDLSDDEMVILVALTAVAISPHLAEQVLAEMSAAPFGLQVDDLMSLLLPCCLPWGLDQLLGLRRHFKLGGRLLDAGLIRVDIKDDALPADLSSAWCQLTAKGFKAITGVES